MSKPLTAYSEGASIGFDDCTYEQKTTVVRWLNKHWGIHRGKALANLLARNTELAAENEELKDRNEQLERALALFTNGEELKALAHLILDVFPKKE